MPRVSSPIRTSDARAQLIERIVQSRYIAKSARLRDLLEYLCDRVLNDGVVEIHEQEVGHAVFERPKDYDTALDNIVRVHASTLRKRLEQYFAEEGREESLILELPKGNYAPVFRERPLVVEAPQPVAVVSSAAGVTPALHEEKRNPLVPILGTSTLLFALSTVFLLWQRTPAPSVNPLPPAVKAFWGAVFASNQKTDIVMDDAALALYQELDGRPISLSEYFDRSYQRRLVNQPTLNSVALKRQSSYANVSLLYSFSKTAEALGSDWSPHFARDYAFRELKSNRAILLGTSRSNPWIEPFENRLAIHWKYDPVAAIYYPFDSSAAGQEDRFRPGGEHPDGYCSVALLPNLGGNGTVAVISGTGGAATAAAGAFLVDGPRMAELLGRVHTASGAFGNFEALIRIPSRTRLPKDAEIVVVREVK